MIIMQNEEIEMKDKEQEYKITLMLRQLGVLPDELTYEVLETSCARFACKEVFNREETIKLCDEYDVTIVFEEKDQKISGFDR